MVCMPTPPHIQSTWLYSEPTTDVIQQAHSIKTGRMRIGKTKSTNSTGNIERNKQEGESAKRQQLEAVGKTSISEIGSPSRQEEEGNIREANNLLEQGSPQGKSSTSGVSQPRRHGRPLGSKSKKRKNIT